MKNNPASILAKKRWAKATKEQRKAHMRKMWEASKRVNFGKKAI